MFCFFEKDPPKKSKVEVPYLAIGKEISISLSE